VTPDDPSRTDPGAGVQWNSIHGDMRNSDGFAHPTADRYEVAWRALEGAAVLFGPSVDAAGNLYVCTGRGAGWPHLHSFTADGDLRWEVPVYSGADAGGCVTPGPRAVPFAPLLDDTGGVYVADEHRFWCFDASGALRWSTDLAELGVGGGFASAIISPGGHVCGLSLDGTALVLDRDTGRPAFSPLKLPVGVAPPSPGVPGGIWQGMMDPATRDTIFPAFFGAGFPLTNSPAVSSVTGLIYITAAGGAQGRTRLFGIREGSEKLQVALDTEFEGFCAVTPSVSTDGRTVYTGNHRGELLAFDATRGDRRWSYAPAASAASPSVGPDGVVYSGCTLRTDGPSQLSAIDPASGAALWRRDYDALARELLGERPVLDDVFPESRPRAVVNSVPTISRTHLLVVLSLGYRFTPPGRAPMLQPHRSVLASIDPTDGSLRGHTVLADSSEASVVLSASGRVYTPHAALTTSMFRAINRAIPVSHGSDMQPAGGFSALRPLAAKAPS